MSEPHLQFRTTFVPTMAYSAQPSFPAQPQPRVSAPPPPPPPPPLSNNSDQAPPIFPSQPPNPMFASASSSREGEHVGYKNRLQELTHKSNIALPVYQSVNEGLQHAPRFRASVLVDGVKYTSPNTFSTRKAAEQDVAQLAFNSISHKYPPQPLPLIHEDTIFCKSILNEFATKMNIQLPTYNTIKPQGLLPVFKSSLLFNGVSYTGGAGKNKKEAEQLAARAVILSLLGDSRMGKVLHDIIKSKVKLYAALDKVNNLSTVPLTTNMTGTGKDVGVEVGGPANEALTAAVSLPTTVDNAAAAVPGSGNGAPKDEFKTQKPEHSFGAIILPEPTSQATKLPIVATGDVSDSGNKAPKHEFKAQKPEHSFGAINLPESASQATKLPIEFVHPTSALSMVTGPSSKKRRKNKKKANKKKCTDAQLSMAALPINQAPPCSVEQ